MNAPTETTHSKRQGESGSTRTDEVGQGGGGGRRSAEKTIGLLKKKPTLGVVLASSLAVVAASVIGVGEVAVAIAAGYAAYRALHA